MSSILIKGNKDGIMIHINSDDYDSVKNEIVNKIKEAKDFFADSKIFIIEDKYKLPKECYEDLKNTLKDMFNIAVAPQEFYYSEKNEKIFSGIYEGRTKFVKNTVRSGQKLSYNGNVVIIGDVNSGAEVIATGNIIVLGVLRGIAHAGANGNKRAFVAAYKLQPELLKITNVLGRSPDGRGAEIETIPELAKIKDDMIMIEPYLPNKYI